MSMTMYPETHPAEGAYDALAPYYDDFIAFCDYEAWTASVEPVVRRHAPGRRLLDLACGTGESTLPFKRRGYDVAGCDLSEQMLAAARLKAPSLRFHRADLRALPELGAYDVLTCFGDCLNYLASPDEVAAAFRSARRNLAPGGVLAFDLNTVAAYRSTFASDRVTDGDGLTFIWRGRCAADAPSGCRAEATIDVLRPAPDGLYALVRTVHRQRHHPAEAIEGLLEQAGLCSVEVLGVRADGSLAPEPDEETLLKTLHVARLEERR
jgi:SAM-dependent methyltransferase